MSLYMAADADPTPKLVLTCLRGALEGRHFVFEQPSVTIGRDPANSLPLDTHKDIRASGHHCEIFLLAGRYLVRDHESTHGTFVNGRRIHEPTLLTPGCILGLSPAGPDFEVQVPVAKALPRALKGAVPMTLPPTMEPEGPEAPELSDLQGGDGPHAPAAPEDQAEPAAARASGFDPMMKYVETMPDARALAEAAAQEAEEATEAPVPGKEAAAPAQEAAEEAAEASQEAERKAEPELPVYGDAAAAEFPVEEPSSLVDAAAAVPAPDDWTPPPVTVAPKLESKKVEVDVKPAAPPPEPKAESEKKETASEKPAPKVEAFDVPADKPASFETETVDSTRIVVTSNAPADEKKITQRREGPPEAEAKPEAAASAEEKGAPDRDVFDAVPTATVERKKKDEDVVPPTVLAPFSRALSALKTPSAFKPFAEKLRDAYLQGRSAVPQRSPLEDTKVEPPPTPVAPHVFKPRDGRQPLRLREQPRDTDIKGYRILSKLGVGHLGTVYQVRHLALRKTMALKLLEPQAGQVSFTDADRLRLHESINRITRMSHPNIALVLAVGEYKNHPYIAEEYLDGGNLESKLRRGPADAEKAVAWTWKMAQALRAAHAVQLFHGDLRPTNIIFDRTGEPKITDFGMSPLVDAMERLSGPNQLWRSPNYQAPEQLDTLRSADPEGVDIFGLGAVLYFMLTGRPPFPSGQVWDSRAEAARVMASFVPDPPRTTNPKAPPWLEAVCMKCLARDPKDRYASINEVCGALEKRAAPQASPATAPASTAPVQKAVPSKIENAGGVPQLGWGVLVVGLLIAAVLTWAMWPGERVALNPGAEKPRPAVPRSDPAGDLAGRVAPLVAQGIEEAGWGDHAAARRQFGLAWKALDSGDASKWPAKAGVLSLLGDRHAWKVADTDDPVRKMAVAVEFRGLLVLTASGRLALWDLTTRRELAGCPGDKVVERFYVHPPGYEVFVRDDQGAWFVWNLRDGLLKPMPALDRPEVRQWAFGIEGARTLAVCENGGAYETCVWEALELPTARVLARQAAEPFMVALAAADRRAVEISHDGLVTVWDATSGGMLAKFQPSAVPIAAVAPSPDGQKMAVLTRDGVLREILIETGAQLRTMPVPSAWEKDQAVATLGFWRDGRTVVALTTTGQAYVWDLGMGTGFGPFAVTGSSVTAADGASERESLYLADAQGTVRIWDGRQATLDYLLGGEETKAADQLNLSRSTEVRARLWRYLLARGRAREVVAWAESDAGAAEAGAAFPYAQALWMLDRRDGAVQAFTQARELPDAPLAYIDLCLRALRDKAEAPDAAGRPALVPIPEARPVPVEPAPAKEPVKPPPPETRQPEPEEKDALKVVPDLTGLTEAAARARIEAAGLRLALDDQRPAAPDAARAARAFRQTPRPGAMEPTGSVVIVALYGAFEDAVPEAPPFFVAFRVAMAYPKGEKATLHERRPGEEAAVHKTRLKKLLADLDGAGAAPEKLAQVVARYEFKVDEEKAENVMVLKIGGGALAAYRADRFAKDTPWAMKVVSRREGPAPDGDQAAMAVEFRGSILLKAVAVHRTLEDVLAAYPLLKKKAIQDARIFPFTAADGTYAVTHQGYRHQLGPIQSGWTDASKAASLRLFAEVFMNCFVAHAVYADPGAPAIARLQAFRDTVLMRTPAGRRLIRYYYNRGPLWALELRQAAGARRWVKGGLELGVRALDLIDSDRPAARAALDGVVRCVDCVMMLHGMHDDAPALDAFQALVRP